MWMDDNILNAPFREPITIQANDSHDRTEFGVKRKIIDEFEKLKSNKPNHINTISIDRAIDIVRKA